MEKKPLKRESGKTKQFISTDTIPISNLASGTPDGTKFVRDDNTLQVPALTANGALVYSNITFDTITAAAETTFTIPSYSVPANSLVAGSIITIRLAGVYSKQVIPSTITAKIKLGGTTYLTTGAITAIGSLTNRGWTALATLTIISVGATGTVQADGFVEFSTAATTALMVNVANTATQVIDTTSAQAITVTITWSTTGNSISLRQAQIFIDNLSNAGTAGTFVSRAQVMTMVSMRF